MVTNHSATMKGNNFSETTSRKFGFIRFTIYTVVVLINTVVALCTLMGKAACFVHPEGHTIPSYLGLAFPYLIIANLAFLLFWMLKRKYYLLLPILTLLICYPETRRTFSIGHNKKAVGDTLSVMSYNVQMFEFFAPLEKNNIIKYIQEQNNDIVCLQEYGHSNYKYYLGEEDVKKAFSAYKYEVHTGSNLTWNAMIGVAILSKYPILQHHEIPYRSELNGGIYADILYKGDTIRVFNCHLESNKITEVEKKTLQKIKGASKEDANNVVTSVSRKMSESYKIRAEQAEVVNQLIKETHYPIILCGDFNDVPVSYAYHTIKGEKLTDSFEECATGYGYTYNKKLFHFRIDQIMHSQEAKAVDFNVGNINYSDHYPISCKIVF